MSGYHNNSIFWVETEKITPNPFQPRREFEPKALEDLADSIRQYGVLQPLVVTRKEIILPDNNGMDVQYELIAGERRLRASKIAGLHQVPVIIRKETDNKVKLELAIIENLQREDLNPIDRALAFEQLHKEFGLTHVEIGKRMGKSRVYVSNSLRLLSLPEDIKQGLMEGRISEGHTRPLLMLIDRPAEQNTLYKEIMVKKLSVRDAEKVARKIAQDKVRKKEFIVDPKIREFEQKLSEKLGTRVHIEPKENGGQITIDYFTVKDLEEIISSMKKVEQESTMMDTYLENNNSTGQRDLEDSTSISFKPSENEIQDTEDDTTSLESEDYNPLSESNTEYDSIKSEQDTRDEVKPYSETESITDEIGDVASDTNTIHQPNLDSNTEFDPYREDISDEPTHLPSLETPTEEPVATPPHREEYAETPIDIQNFNRTDQPITSHFDDVPEVAIPEFSRNQESSPGQNIPPLDAAYQNYSSLGSHTQSNQNNKVGDYAPYPPVHETPTQQRNVDQRQPQYNSQDAYYNPDYYQQPQSNQESRKKGILGKLFG